MCNRNKCIILIGMPGAGKSTLGKKISDVLKFDFLDLDEYISSKEGMNLQKIIDVYGENTFLQIEKRRMYEIPLNNIVIAPGGSIIYNNDLMEHLSQNAIVIYLDNSLKNVESRLDDISTRGVIGLKIKTLKQIYKERVPRYFKYANIVIDCRDKTEAEISDEIIKHYSMFIKEN